MYSEIISLIIASVLLLGSPGPAPLTLAAVSSTFGLKAGIRFLIGILLGLAGALVLTGMGVTVLLNSSNVVKIILGVISVSYLLFVAYKIAFLKPSHSGVDKVPSGLDGFILNIFNPKAYAAFMAIFATYRLPFENVVLSSVVTGIICFVCGCIVDIAWVYFGSKFSNFLKNPKYEQKIRYVFSSLIIATLFMSYFL